MSKMNHDRKRCIVVADDEPSIRRMVTVWLRRHGYEVCEAENGDQALKAMREGAADLVVLDLMMPQVSGWDVLDERARDQNLARIPVIVVSAARGPEVGKAVSAGICALLPKPFELDALRVLIESCLAHPHPPTVFGAGAMA
jgi:CheY-like chemotaxis protein